jgi:hypothetical protein
MEEHYAEYTVRMKTLWFVIIAILLFSCEGFAQVDYSELPKTNLNLFREITSKSLNELEDVITIVGKEKIYKISIDFKDSITNIGRDKINKIITDDEIEKKDFFVNELKQKFQKVKFVYEVSDTVDFVVKFSDLNLKTNYSKLKTKYILGDEYFDRELIVMYNYSVSGKDVKVSKFYRDEVKADRLEYIESGNYAFLKSVLPEKSFLKKIIVPAVIVAVSAIATILFFTIRSK